MCYGIYTHGSVLSRRILVNSIEPGYYSDGLAYWILYLVHPYRILFKEKEDYEMSEKIVKLVVWTIKFGFTNLCRRIFNRRLINFQASNNFQPGLSSITDSANMAEFPSLCGSAAAHEQVFANFRSSRIMVKALDHVSIEQGNAYIAEILKEISWSSEFTWAIQQIDRLGRPRKYKFGDYGLFSPTLLRYLKVYIDLKKYFGCLAQFNIAEIGVGFGGQSSLISLLDEPSSYTFYDIPPVLDLTRRFIDEVPLTGDFEFIDGRNPKPSNPDLVISNYAFSELKREVQDSYLNNVIRYSSRGYITWNSLSADYLDGYSLGDLIRIIPDSQIVPEIPSTSSKNVIIVWGMSL
jgi:hypothetical protein